MIDAEKIFAAFDFGNFFYTRAKFSRANDVKRARGRLALNDNACGENRRA